MDKRNFYGFQQTNRADQGLPNPDAQDIQSLLSLIDCPRHGDSVSNPSAAVPPQARAAKMR
ncbi:MAG: hypothetical protein IGS50_18085 [Synechococcales cyanobacterium C42_A2020_086]|nr:hypothetical protein [Synechococcales cyanobacterium M58_A2018_015]MBF2075654.1 hypothetical protein [Synechococcales cyanobacterium C42_A2020_086]